MTSALFVFPFLCLSFLFQRLRGDEKEGKLLLRRCVQKTDAKPLGKEERGAKGESLFRTSFVAG